MAVSDARRNPVVKRFAVYVRRVANGVEQLVRRPYDVVAYDWGNGESTTYLQPFSYYGTQPTQVEDVYAGIRIYDKAPIWDIVPNR